MKKATHNCIAAVFEETVKQNGDKIALIQGNQTLTYNELNQRANQLARYLRKQKVKRNTYVGMCLQRGFDQIISILAILKAGGAYIPIDPKYPLERFNYILSDTKTPILITQSKLKNNSLKMINLDVKKKILSKESNKNLPKINLPSDIAYIIYTSGSTGQPKGVLVPHRAIVNIINSTTKTLKIANSERVLQFTSISFDVSVWEIFLTILNGLTLCLLPDDETYVGPMLEQLIKDYQITLLMTTPSVLNTLQNTYHANKIIIGGEAPSQQLVNKWIRKVKLFNAYGPTETTVVVSIHDYHKNTMPRVIGKPIANTRFYVLDNEQKQVAAGKSGELYITGDGVSQGYLNKPDITKERFIANPFMDETAKSHEWNMLYRSGDVVRLHHNNEIEYLDRIDHQVKIRGYRIEVGEIENIIRHIENVKDCIVVAREDVSTATKYLVAYILSSKSTAAKSHHSLIKKIKKHLVHHLPSYMIPSKYVVLAKFPLTLNQKIDKKALPKPVHIYRNEPFTLPTNHTEKKILSIWKNLLKAKKISTNDDFFNVGGNSINAVVLTDKLRQEIDNNVLIKNCYEFPTISQFAKFINEKNSPQKPRLLSKFVYDIKLNKNIYVNDTYQNTYKNILLTGATGFLGVFLLRDLLREHPKAKIYCLIRAESKENAQARILESFKRYRITVEKTDLSRIIPLPGNLADPSFNLSKKLFDQLANDLDVIYHNAALVNFVYTYDQLKSINVDATKQILQLATLIKPKTVHYISTLSVFPAANEMINENDNLISARNLADGYSQSKYVSDRLMLLARERGINVNIYRPGRIAGNSETGAWNTEDFVCRMFKSFIELKCAPLSNAYIDLLPVDIVSKIIIISSSQKQWQNKNVHLIHPNPILLSDICSFMIKIGYPLHVDVLTWFGKIINQQSRSLIPFSSMFEGLTEKNYLDTIFHDPRIFDTTNMKAIAHKNKITLPSIYNLLPIYFQYFQQIDYIHKGHHHTRIAE